MGGSMTGSLARPRMAGVVVLVQGEASAELQA